MRPKRRISGEEASLTVLKLVSDHAHAEIERQNSIYSLRDAWPS
jgi:hypothetical protein